MPPFDGEARDPFWDHDDFRRVFWDQDMIDTLKRMTARGKSLAARAKAVGVDERTLRAYCVKHGIRRYVI